MTKVVNSFDYGAQLVWKVGAFLKEDPTWASPFITIWSVVFY